MDHPRSALPLPFEGAEARGSKPTCVGLDGPKNGRVLRPCGLQGPLAVRQSRFASGCLATPREERVAQVNAGPADILLMLGSLSSFSHRRRS